MYLERFLLLEKQLVALRGGSIETTSGSPGRISFFPMPDNVLLY